MALDRRFAPVFETIMNIVPFVGQHGPPCATQHIFVKCPRWCLCAKFATWMASTTSRLSPQSKTKVW